MPKALTIIQNRLSILLYAVHAATVSVPNAFTLDWIRILDDVYITDCNPAGSPIRMILWNILPSKRIFLSSRRCISFVRISTHNTSTALSACDSIVASAAPATPICNPMTNAISSTILVRQLTIRKYSGLLESPTARRIPAPML